jgi:hypothetical protein
MTDHPLSDETKEFTGSSMENLKLSTALLKHNVRKATDQHVAA